MLAYMLFNKHTSAPPMISLLQCPVPLSTFASRTNEKQSKKKNSSSAPRLSRSLRPRRRIIGRRPCRRLNTLSSVRACACVCTKKKRRKKNRRGNSQSPHTAKKGEREEKRKDTEQTKRTTINVTKKRSGTTLRESLSPRRVTKSFLTKHHVLFTVVDVSSEDVIVFDTRIYSRTSPESWGWRGKTSYKLAAFV